MPPKQLKAVGIVIVNVDDPRNRPSSSASRSSRVGKVFHRGRFALDYGGGSQEEIVEWMLAMRDELQRGAAATRRAGKANRATRRIGEL